MKTLLITLFTALLIAGCGNSPTEPAADTLPPQKNRLMHIELTTYDNTIIYYDIIQAEYDNTGKENLLILSFEVCGEVYPNFTETIKQFRITQ